MKKHYIFISLIALAVTLTACGGGGGEGEGTTGGVSYTGSKNPVTLTSGVDGNAAEVTESSIQGANQGISSGTVIGVVTDTDNDQISSKSYNLLIPRALAKTVQNIHFDATVFLPGATVTQSDTFDCDGGGSGSITLEGDDQTGVFSGTMSFNGCTSLGVTMSGSISVSGRVDLAADELEQMTMSFNSLTSNDGIYSVTLGGTISIQYNYPTLTMSMDFVAQNNSTGEQVKLENYSMVVTETGLDEFNVTLSGRFYHSDYGYVDITTPQTLYYDYSSSMWPYAGQILLDGDSSAARATCINSTQYTLEVDEDGDGTYDTTTTETW
jgi:hypothetical protein